jgi:hypothetical protein
MRLPTTICDTWVTVPCHAKRTVTTTPTTITAANAPINLIQIVPCLAPFALGHETIAHAVDGLDEAAVAAGIPQFLTDVFNMDVDSAFVAGDVAHGVVLGYVEQFGAAERTPWVLHKVVEQIELGAGQIHRVLGQSDGAVDRVHAQIVELKESAAAARGFPDGAWRRGSARPVRAG